MSELRLFVPIDKVDAAKRIVYGTITAEVPDRSGEIFDYASGKPAVQAWSDEINEASGGKSKGNVRAMHNNIAAGKFTDIVFDDDNRRIEGAAKIVDDDEWRKVEEGVYTGFSIGGKYTRRWQDPSDPTKWRFTPEMVEVSLVDSPCVPTATFEYIKADGSVEMRKFTPSHKEDSMDPKALAAAKDALAKGTATDEQKALIAQADAELLKAAQDADAKGEATDEQKALLAKVAADAEATKVVLTKDGKPVKPKAAPVQFNKWQAADGSFHDSKREAEVHNLHIEKQAELAPALSQMDELLKAAKKPAEEDEDEEGDDEDTKKAKKERREAKAAKAKEKAEKDDAEMAAKAKKEKEDADKAAKDKEDAEKAAAAARLQKKDYTDKEREEMADKGEAMKDGSFPIANKKDLENAIQAFGRAKDKDEVKAHIKARAKALDAEDLLPADWKDGKKKDKKEKSVPKGKLAKGLHMVGWLAHLLSDLQCLQENVTLEQYFEDDKDSELPVKFKSLVAEMCEVLVTLVEAETSELTEGDDTDVEVLEMAAGLPAGHPEAIAKFARAKAVPLEKSDSKKESETASRLIKFAETMEKAGARHSKVDAERVQKLHDHAEDVHKCMGEMAEKCVDMHKAAAEAKNTAIDLGAKGERADEEDDNDGASKSAVKMSKLYEQLNAKTDEVLAVTKVAAASNQTLLKAIPLIESLQKTISDQNLRIEHLEKQPAAPKGNVRGVSKTQDSGGANGETEAEYEAKLAKMSDSQRTRELMKRAMSNPQEMPNL